MEQLIDEEGVTESIAVGAKVVIPINVGCKHMTVSTLKLEGAGLANAADRVNIILSQKNKDSPTFWESAAEWQDEATLVSGTFAWMQNSLDIDYTDDEEDSNRYVYLVLENKAGNSAATTFKWRLMGIARMDRS